MLKDKGYVRPEKKKYQIKTIAFKAIVSEIPMFLNFIPTSSELGFNLTSAIGAFFFAFNLKEKALLYHS